MTWGLEQVSDQLQNTRKWHETSELWTKSTKKLTEKRRQLSDTFNPLSHTKKNLEKQV
jgi:hypothetical protein